MSRSDIHMIREYQPLCLSIADLIAFLNRHPDGNKKMSREILYLQKNGFDDTEAQASLELGRNGFLNLPVDDSKLKKLLESSPEGAINLLGLGIRCFNQFLQANWTGPSVSENIIIIDSESEQTVEKLLEIDGEVPYSGCSHKELLAASLSLFKFLCKEACLDSAGVWHARAVFIWQRILSDSNDRGQGNCPSLMEVCVKDYCEALGSFGYLPRDLVNETLSHLPTLTSR